MCARGEQKLGRGGVSVPDRGDRPGQTVNRSPGGIQAAGQQASGGGVIPTWEKRFFGGLWIWEG